jgi:N6-adenosine-specific RNA methylase IME4
MSAIDLAIKKHVPTIADAIKSLAAMGRQLDAAKTYDQIRRVIKEATALKVLFGHINEVKAVAEDTILTASIRIGEEIKKVPKAGGPGRGKRNRQTAKSLSGRGALDVPKDSRSRLTRLADHGTAEVKKAAKELREQGKDATPRAVAAFLTQGDKKERRAERERELGQRQIALPDQKQGVIVEDYEWDFEVFSRETGMDRHAANHYPVSEDAHTAEEIMKRTADRFGCAANDCALFMWTTVPHLAIAIDLLRLRGFRYVTNWVWDKIKIGTGYWNRNRHEILLLGIRGNVPCPAPGEQWESLFSIAATEHSAKPEHFLEMIEAYFPTMPKIELNRRGPPRPGWSAWGYEAETSEAAE